MRDDVLDNMTSTGLTNTALFVRRTFFKSADLVEMRTTVLEIIRLAEPGSAIIR